MLGIVDEKAWWNNSQLAFPLLPPSSGKKNTYRDVGILAAMGGHCGTIE